MSSYIWMTYFGFLSFAIAIDIEGCADVCVLKLIAVKYYGGWDVKA